jgi:hypothetical protein
VAAAAAREVARTSAPHAPSPSRGDGTLVDGLALERLRMLESHGAAGLLATLVDTFLQRAELRLTVLRTLAETPRRGELAHEALVLATACAPVGAVGMRAQWVALQHAAPTASPAELQALLAQAAQTLADTRAQYARLVRR